VVTSDALHIGPRLRPELRERVGGIHAGSLLNELFRGGPRAAIALLRRLRALFPDRLLFVTDYYGRLTHEGSSRARDLHAMLQDFVQAVSGQGIPPRDLDGWCSVYRAAGCAPIEAFEGTAEGLAWFIHVVRLSPGAPSAR
jgi:hypothetical protein